MDTTRNFGWVIVDQQTGLVDGYYHDVSLAKHIRGWLEAKWSGSKWDLKKADGIDDPVRHRFHQDHEDLLIATYCEPDWAACDDYDRRLPNG